MTFLRFAAEILKIAQSLFTCICKYVNLVFVGKRNSLNVITSAPFGAIATAPTMSNLVVFVRIGDIFQTLNIQGLSLYGIFALFLRVLCLAAFWGILRFLHFLAILCAFLAHSAPPLPPPGVFLPCIFGGLSIMLAHYEK